MEEVDDLRQGLLGLVLPGHVPEGDAGLLLHIDLGVGLAHAADAPNAAHAAFFGHPAPEEGEHQHDEEEGQDVADEEGHARGHGGRVGPRRVAHALLGEEGDEVVVIDGHGVEALAGEGLAVLIRIGVVALRGEAQELGVRVKADELRLAVLDEVDEGGVGDLRRGGVAGAAVDIEPGVAEHQRQQQGPGHQAQDALRVFAALVVLVVALVVLIHQRGLLSAGEGPGPPGRGNITGIENFQDIIARNGATNKDRPWNFDKFSVNLLS